MLSEKLRQECMPLKYKSFLEDVSQGKVEELKTVDLTFCTLQEPDVDKVMEALKACVHTITLDLQYNELKVSGWARRLNLAFQKSLKRLSRYPQAPGASGHKHQNLFANRVCVSKRPSGETSGVVQLSICFMLCD